MSGARPSGAALALALALALPPLLAGCALPGQRVVDTTAVPPAAVKLYLTRPFQVLPEPDAFVEGVLTSVTEQLGFLGYDVVGTRAGLDEPATIQADLAQANLSVPGTAGVHFVFREAPLVVGFGSSYGVTSVTVYSPDGRVVLQVELDPPVRRSLKELLLPPKQPDVDGRYFGQRAFDTAISLVFPPRD